MDLQVRNSLRCQVNNCGKLAIGVNPYNNEWICGLCLKKLDDMAKVQRQKYYEFLEKQLAEENKK